LGALNASRSRKLLELAEQAVDPPTDTTVRRGLHGDQDGQAVSLPSRSLFVRYISELLVRWWRLSGVLGRSGFVGISLGRLAGIGDGRVGDRRIGTFFWLSHFKSLT
jgi:hypothetical protein